MGRRAPTRSGAGGGEGIAQIRPIPRLGAASGALLTAIAFALWTSWPGFSGTTHRYLPALAFAGLILLVVALLGFWTPGIAWGVGVLAASYLLRLQLDPAVAAWTPIAAGWLLLVAELSYWSYELDSESKLRGNSRTMPRLFQFGLLALATASAGELLTVAARLLPAAGSWSLLEGAAAVAILLGLLLWLARRGDRGLRDQRSGQGRSGTSA